MSASERLTHQVPALDLLISSVLRPAGRTSSRVALVLYSTVPGTPCTVEALFEPHASQIILATCIRDTRLVLSSSNNSPTLVQCPHMPLVSR